MPRNPRLDAVLNRSLSNQILSRKEIKRIKKEAQADGVVTPDEVKQVTTALADAIEGDALTLDTDNRKARVNDLLGAMESHAPTGINAPNGDYISAIMGRTAAPATGTELPTQATDGQSLGVAADGALALGGQQVNLKNFNQATVTASLTLAKAGNLEGLPDAQKSALASSLAANLAATFPVVGEDGRKGMYKEMAALGGQAAALRQLAGNLDGASIDNLLAAHDKAPSDMVKSQLQEALKGATNASDAQKTKIATLGAPEFKTELLAAWDAMAGSNPKIGFLGAKGPVQDVALSALAFAKKPASLENLDKGLKVFKDMNKGDFSQPFDAAEAQKLNTILEGYCEKHGSTSYVFGTFAKDTPKALATITNERLQKVLLPELVSDTPSFKGVPLTKAQAARIKDEILPGLRDDRAADAFKEAMSEAAMLSSTETPSWRGASAPTKPLSPAAEDLLIRSITPYVKDRGATETGMIDTGKMLSAVEDKTKAIRTELALRMKSLDGAPPSWNGIEVGDATKAILLDIVENNMRSPMSIDNLDRGLQRVAEKFGGAVTGNAEIVFKAVVDEYKSHFPDLKTLDFNKLERIAKFKADGKDVPLATINGKKVPLGRFYGQVGSDVAGVVDKTQLRHAWQADRLGTRARNSVELIDVFAEQAARGEGPVAALKKRFPGADVKVVATGQDFAHQEFLFSATKNGRTTLYNQGSDGKISAYRGRTDPELFKATINDDGSYDVKIPSEIKTRRYAVQTPYSVGDVIDVPFRDGSATEVRTEGEKFDTKYKILEGTITGFSADGQYTVKYNAPDGVDDAGKPKFKEVEETQSWSDVRKANHPHYFNEGGSFIRDMKFDINNDADMKKFLDDAQPIIDRHLPVGQTASMSPAALTEAQKNLVKDLMDYAAANMKYPGSKETSTNVDDKAYWKLDDIHRFKFGELVKINRGVCRHQCMAEHLLLQRAGIDSRLASGAANTSSGNYRGLHLWLEIQTADGARYLTDQTWKDKAIPLWDGAYDADKRRVEIGNRTTDFDRNIAQ